MSSSTLRLAKGQIINCTPHEITILGGEGVEYIPAVHHTEVVDRDKVKVLMRLAPCGVVPRVEYAEEEIGEILSDTGDGVSVPVVRATFPGIKNLPPEKEGVFYVVSAIVLTEGKKRGRKDLLVPSRMVYDRGRVVGCRALGA